MTDLDDVFRQFDELRTHGGRGRRGKPFDEQEAFRRAVSDYAALRVAEEVEAIAQLKQELLLARKLSTHTRDGVTATAEEWASVAHLLREEVRRLKAALEEVA
jgi:phage host-nuclease inhibitor protein Gam